MTSPALTEQQLQVLDYLFDDECKGKPRDAMRKAGYSDTYASGRMMAILAPHILERTRNYLSMHGPAAAMALTDGLGMDGPVEPDTKEKLAAAREILDRGVGLVKTDRMEVSGVVSGIVYLPAKEPEQEIDD
jgi:hypothetical protein